jgi:hypothetical protein
MKGPSPERKPHFRVASQDAQSKANAEVYSSGTRLLRICWLVLGSTFLLVIAFTLFTIIVKEPNPPSTVPAEQPIAQQEKESPQLKPDGATESEPLQVDPKPEDKRRDHSDEVARVLGGSFHPSHEEASPTLVDSPPPLPPPTIKAQPVIAPKASPQIPTPTTTISADSDIEKRLQSSEEDLRQELQSVPELRLFSDLTVADFRDREKKDERAVRGLPRDQIDFAYNMQLNKYMRQAGIKEGLPLLSGPTCQLDPVTASTVQTLSSTLRSMGFSSVPGTPVRVISRSNGRVFNVSGTTTKNGTPKEKIEAFKEWCDVNSVEKFRGALATLLQVLQVEDVPMRLLLVRELAKALGAETTAALAKRAMVDLSPDVRQAAVDELEKRPAGQYVPVLLKGLRYPWPPVADHAALALRKLKPKGAVPKLVELLDQPDPTLPILDKRTQKPVVRELVRLNHMRHCLLCHAPSANTKDGLVRGLVPIPGQPLPKLYYAGQTGNFVRADITFLRQDFSDNLPVAVSAPWPKEQRFDFVTRIRPVSPEERAKSTSTKPGYYPQRDAVLYALRGITGKDVGDSSDEWRKTLGFAVQATEKKKDASLDKTLTPPKD